MLIFLLCIMQFIMLTYYLTDKLFVDISHLVNTEFILYLLLRLKMQSVFYSVIQVAFKKAGPVFSNIQSCRKD